MSDELGGRDHRDDPVESDPLDQDLGATEGLTGTVVRGAGMAAVGYALAQALTLGFYIALARLISPDDFGEFAAGSIVISVGLLFTESGMLAALIHRRDRVEEAASTAVLATLAAGLLFSLGALALSPAIGAFFDSGRIGAIAAVLSGLLFVRSLQVVPEALLQRRFSFLRRMVIEPLEVIAFGIAAVIACSNGLGPWGLVIGYYAAAAVDAVLSWVLVRWRPRLRLASVAIWRELVRYGRHVVAANLVVRAGNEVPTALIGRFVGSGALGQYRYSSRMASTGLGLIVAGASYVIFPAFARISADQRRFSDAFLTSLRWFSSVALPLSLILVPLGIPLAVVVFGEQWRDAGEAAMALSGYAVGACMVSIVSEGLKAAGRPRALVDVHLISFGCATAAMLALLGFDLIGVCAGLSIGVLIGGVYGLLRLGRVLEVPARAIGARLWAPAVASIAMAAALLPVDRLLVQPDEHATALALLLLGAETLAAAGVYAAALITLAPDTIPGLRSIVRQARDGRGRRGATADAGEAVT